jgi:hypothetical protein
MVVTMIIVALRLWAVGCGLWTVDYRDRDVMRLDCSGITCYWVSLDSMLASLAALCL